jgi:arylsulfatase A-like enzyme
LCLLALALNYNKPGYGAGLDPRTPDIIVTPNIGVTYSGSTSKLSEHGGFAHDDTNVMLLVANPSIARSTVHAAVETTQIAPTVLSVLGLDPRELDGVREEGTAALPAIDFTKFSY